MAPFLSINKMKLRLSKKQRKQVQRIMNRVNKFCKVAMILLVANLLADNTVQ